MQKLRDYWDARNNRQRMILAAAFIVSFLGILALAGLAGRTQMALLYSGLDPARAGEVVQAIERSGTKYELRGESIYVDARERDRLRLTLAGEGLPAQGGAGYELLDGISGFGTTSQMFDAAYWRAKEGELARTILSMPNVKTARVHLAASNARGFRRNAPSGASVTIQTNGVAVSAEQANSLRFLVASAAPGMTPENVTVIDTDHGVVSPANDTDAGNRSQDLKRNVERILESHVGPGNAIVELSLDIATETEQVTEHRVDPEARALISQEVEETTDQSDTALSGPVTAASNLPEGPQSDADRNSSSRNATRQRNNFEVSQLTREVSRQPGAIRRMTVAVLVNGVAQTDADGKTNIVSRPETELAVMRELAAMAVGLDEQRGDQLTIKSLPFAELSQQGTLAEPSGLISLFDLNTLAKIALVGLFLIALSAMLLRGASKTRAAPALPAALDETLPQAPEPEPEMDIFSPGDQSDDMPMLSMGDGFAMGGDDSDPVARMKGLMSERREESLKLLASWLDDKEAVQ
ncbi:flagellar basal-body MS-ring/collar protein FliF [Paracoccus jiaweipingae]|uniref:flagellar basal-body MS-ring/collar protein FliF n=1 Tax=unclassified Paracoccus (in: a-proteobacteria) TaxID=2688777 RepID=UPI0037A5A02E